MGRTIDKPPELDLDDDAFVPLTLHVPASPYRTLHMYGVYRRSGDEMIPKAAAAAVRWYFERSAGFQAWLREHADEPVTLPQTVVRPTRRRRVRRADAAAAAPVAPVLDDLADGASLVLANQARTESSRTARQKDIDNRRQAPV